MIQHLYKELSHDDYLNNLDIYHNPYVIADTIHVHYTTKYEQYASQYLTFEAIYPCVFQFTNTTNSIDYSIDNGTTWITLAPNTNSPTIGVGNKILWKTTNPTITKVVESATSSGIGTFSSTGFFKAYGNVHSLVFGDNFTTNATIPIANDFQFAWLFKNCSNLNDAENIILPSTTLTNRCYWQMFESCSNLEKTPILYAKTLADYCYCSMFKYCYKLKNAQKINTYNFALGAYNEFLYGCPLIDFIDFPCIANMCSNSEGTYGEVFHDFVTNCAPTGTILRDPRSQWYCASDDTTNTIYPNIPANWNVVCDVATDSTLKLYYDYTINRRYVYSTAQTEVKEIHLSTSTTWMNIAESPQILPNKTAGLQMEGTYTPLYDITLTRGKYTWGNEYITLGAGTGSTNYGPRTNYQEPSSIITSGSTLEAFIGDLQNFTIPFEKYIFANLESGGFGFDADTQTYAPHSVKFRYVTHIGGAYTSIQTPLIPKYPNKWYHVVAVREYIANPAQNITKIYVNGKLYVQGNFGTPYKLTTKSTKIEFLENPAGTTNYACVVYPFHMTTFRYYERPLSQEEIIKNFKFEVAHNPTLEIAPI